MPSQDKDTIYIDIDDEITGVIDKVKNSKSKVVALVLPKRAGVFQSVVNMKLLKRAADSGQKNVVLITSEAGLLPLAGSAGLHVAKTLTTKPEIPGAPEEFVDSDEAVDEDAATLPGDENPLDANKTVGELAGPAAATVGADGVETVALDNESPPPEEAEKSAPSAAAKKKTPKNKKLRVPNFKRFRKLIIIGIIILLLLIAAFVFANIALAKATIDISTNATNVPTNLNLTLSASADTVNTNTDTLPAKLGTIQKTYTQQVTTTGQKNEGNKASGTITVSVQQACGSQPPSDIPAGTGLTANNLTYILDDDVTFSNGTIQNKQCQFQGTDETNPGSGGNIPITAQSGGANYNVSGVSFSIAGYSGASANGSASGGTDNIVQTVNQADINSAKAKINASASGINQNLQTQLKGDGYYPITATYSSGTPDDSYSANVGDAANSVSVTESITYTMFGVYKNDLSQLINNSVDAQIDTSKQSVLDDGLSTADFTVNSQSNNQAQISLSTKAIAGPELNTASIRQSAAGKKTGDVKSQLLTDPDVTGVNIKLSPFWVSSLPSKTSRITVDVAKPKTSTSGSSNDNQP
jgi:cytoskeletal protein RodZ